VKKNQKGFSLIELLIVVAIILIIAAIAIPNLLRSRMAANEASAVGSMRTINTGAVTYSSTYPSSGYPANLKNLGTSGAATSGSADLVDSVLAGGTKSGYTFKFTATATLFDRLLDRGDPGFTGHFRSARLLHRPIRL